MAHHRYCSTYCRQRVYADSGKASTKDARWYAANGWYRQARSKLRLRIQQRLEDLA